MIYFYFIIEHLLWRNLLLLKNTINILINTYTVKNISVSSCWKYVSDERTVSVSFRLLHKVTSWCYVLAVVACCATDFCNSLVSFFVNVEQWLMCTASLASTLKT